MSEKSASSLYSYVVRSDSGFAPNPFGEYCTLACCKPQIRRHASVGDWVVGSGSKRTVGNEKMVYAMRITEKLSFDEYANNPRFRYKVPSKGIIQERGDNIYFRDSNGDWKQRPSYHKEKQMEADLRGEYVLVSDDFFYFGANAVLVPEKALKFSAPDPRRQLETPLKQPPDYPQSRLRGHPDRADLLNLQGSRL